MKLGKLDRRITRDLSVGRNTRRAVSAAGKAHTLGPP
jgi:hypothetical protein